LHVLLVNELLSGEDERGARALGRNGTQQLETLPDQQLAAADDAGYVAARTSEAGGKSELDRACAAGHDDGHAAGLLVRGAGREDGPGHDDIRLCAQKVLGVRIEALERTFVPPHLERKIAALCVTQRFHSPAEHFQVSPLRMLGAVHQDPNAPPPRRLWESTRQRREHGRSE
jgi:hypothetical protein